jgi:hypothetical protein
VTHQWDEFSKLLAEPVPRRESMRRLGVVFAGAVLSPLRAGTAWAGRPDPCKSFCRCRKKSDQNACLAACSACGKDTSRLCGACGTYVCCPEPGPNEYGMCVDGQCYYECVEGAVRCDGMCTFLDSDPDNCGACGNVCTAPTPYCTSGTCSVCPGVWYTLCNGVCVDTTSDPSNCGGCGQVCAAGEGCYSGVCCDPTVSDCSGGLP